MKTGIIRTVIMSLCLQMIVLSDYVPQASAAPKPAGADRRGERFIPNTFFGVTTHINSEQRGCLKMLKLLNIRTVRLDFPLRVVAAEDGGHHFSGNFVTDSADLGASLNLDQMALIGRPPAWMAARTSRVFPNDQSVEAFEEFMYALATHYKGKITNWEGPNEEHMPNWGPRYVTMLKALYRGIKRADPKNVVILGTFDTSESASLDEAYRHGIKGYFDVLNTHPYTWPKLPEEGGYLDRIEELREVMKKYGDDKPIWVTEIGWNGVEPSMLEHLRSKYPIHKARSITEEDQARALARLYLISTSIPSVERVYFFGLGHTDGSSADYGEESESELEYMSLYQRWAGGVRPKPAFFSLRTVIKMIGETNYKGRIEVGSRIWALKFQRASEAIVAIWSLDEDVTMTLKDTSVIQSITSMVGTPMLVSDELRLSGRPIYLKVAAKNLAQLEKEIQGAKLLGA